MEIYLTCLVWYSSSTLTSNIGKEILTEFKYPVTLTIIQFGLASFFSWAYGTFFISINSVNKKFIIQTFPLALFQIFGHIFSSTALGYIPVSFSHTIKVFLYL